MSSRLYDVAIIGSGFAGSALAAILARQGLDVIVLEAGVHPRFAIGESMILETSETLRALAALYDVPELAYFSAEPYLSLAGSSHGVKRHFGFLHHDAEGQHNPADPNQTLQAVIPREPHGHELHLFRQDADALLVHAAMRYGAEVRQRVCVDSVRFEPDAATLETSRGEVRARFVADASGARSVLVRQLELAEDPPDLTTHSRALFTHMLDVGQAERSGARDGLPFRMDEGTLHHVFPGGWLWAIPFGNHKRATNPLTSVGLMLDPRVWPERPDRSPEAEFLEMIARFPIIASQFAEARTARPWVRTGRIQHRPSKMAGDRWALLGLATGVVDPLFSKGLYSTLVGVALLARTLLDAKRGPVPASALATYSSTMSAFLRENDQLVATAYHAFGDPRLWAPVSVLWLLGAYAEYARLLAIRYESEGDPHRHAEALGRLQLVGGGFAGFADLSDRLTSRVLACDLSDEAAVRAVACDLRCSLEAVDWLPAEFRAVLHGRSYLERRKLRPSALTQPGGIMGPPAFRSAVYGNLSFGRLVRSAVLDKVRYSHPSRPNPAVHHLRTEP